MKRYYLTIDKGALQTSVYPLTGPTTIGRSPENTIELQGPTISRRHARVYRDGDTWMVEDLGSTNGVLVDGIRVERQPLKSGDAFKIGEITFRFREEEVKKTSEQMFDTVEILSASIEDVGKHIDDPEARPNPERLRRAIATIPFFSSLGEKELAQLADTATLHVFHPGEIIIREGDPGRSVFLILHGRVRVFTRDYHGNELELAVLESSQFFGEISFLTGEPRLSYVAALEASVLIELSYTTMRKLVEQHPPVRETLVRYYKERVRDTQEKRAEMGMPERRRHQRLRERLAVSFMPVVEGGESGETIQGYSVDISLSGIVFVFAGEPPERLPVGGTIRLRVKLAPPGEEFRCLAVIRRLQVKGEEKKRATALAAEFTNMTSSDAERLKNFLTGKSELAS